jgi:hypothetical protein
MVETQSFLMRAISHSGIDKMVKDNLSREPSRLLSFYVEKETEPVKERFVLIITDV